MKSPKERAKRFLSWLATQKAWTVTYQELILVDDKVTERLAEVIADAQDDVREGFLRPPTGREPIIHD